MELQQLRYFCAVARTGSFTRAAVEEGVAQPSLSQQLSKLEKTLQAKLFDRLGRSVRLTEYGRMLLPQAMEILRQVNGARTTIESLRRGVQGHLAVGCIPTITPYYLAPRLGQFAARYPDVELHLVEGITSKLVELLQAGELDIAVVGLPVKSPDLLCSELFREPIRLAVGKGHRLASQRMVKIAELREEKILLLREGHCFRNNALTVCHRARTQSYSMFETDQFSSVLPLVAAGFGISLVPEMVTRSTTECRFLPLEREGYRRVGYVRARRHLGGPAQTAFVSWLREMKDQAVG